MEHKSVSAPGEAEETQVIAEWRAYAAEFPHWYVWRGVAGHYYARIPMSSPPHVVRAQDPEDLRDAIARAEMSRRVVSSSHFRNHCA